MTKTQKKVKKVKIQDVIAKSSKVITTDYYKMNAHPKGTVSNENEHTIVEQILREDEEIRGFYGFVSDSIYDAGYRLEGTDKEVVNASNKLDKIRFPTFYSHFLNTVLPHNDVFIEIIPSKAGQPLELKIQPSKNVYPKITKTGEVLGYVYSQEWVDTQKLQTKDLTWTTDEMVHIQIDKIGTGFWTTTQIKTLEYWIKLKRKTERYIDYLYETNQFKSHFHARRLSVADTEAFVTSIREGMKQWDKFLITAGEEDMSPKQIKNPNEIEFHIRVLDECRNKILSLIRVPPIVAGTVDNSNRSNSDIQARFTFSKRVRRLMHEIEQEIQHKLFPKLGIPDRVKFKHHAVDLRDDSENIDICLKLLGAGADKIMMLEWLNKRGLDLPEGLFDKAVEEHEQAMDKMNSEGSEDSMHNDGTVKLPKNSNLNPSRQPQKKDTADYGREKNPRKK